MKTMRICNSDGCSYVERQFFRRWWIRVSPYYRSNIESWNWLRGRSGIELIRSKK